jgi:hypothetical protein
MIGFAGKFEDKLAAVKLDNEQVVSEFLIACQIRSLNEVLERFIALMQVSC